ncbi:putative exocyst complex component Exo70, cullin repeat-like-containing domain-containing protein [Rosa chinensis]|uniref:Exocyst subunit Exo70 family protein n=1 Tax=Rosa chinensis TaxID=74649 RepID=A0A2P6RYV4_ROSCH|nr:exocyst complex component EXO70A1 [Rosa chinensis]PRQ51609.1 putative exocyst complex component Exo70, cullin repeat-like-containing domain-containing protein [Rosa chinensis]
MEASPPSSPPELDAAERIILRWDSTASEEARERMIFEGHRDEVDHYLQAVDEIQRSMSAASLAAASEDEQAKLNSAIQIAMARLEDEFRNILLNHTSPIEPDSLTSSGFDPGSSSSSRRFSTDHGNDHSAEFEVDDFPADDDGGGSTPKSSSADELLRRGDSSNTSSYRSTSSIRELDLIPSDAVIDLRNIAERMIAAGYLRECIQVYGSVRKSAVDSSFRRLGIEKLSIGDVQRLQWEELEAKIRRWIRAAKACIRIVFASEKKLCEQIFQGIGTAIDDACFMETVKGPAIQLFNFAEAISISRRSPEKLFKILDLHDALLDLVPDIDAVFESKSSESIRIQAAEILSRLAEAARGILSEFENAVLREPSRVPVPGGTIHPLTRYVMNYIALISDYKQTLNELIVSKPSTGSRYSGDPTTPDMEFAELEGKTPLALHLIWIIVILQFNLDGKSKHYKDASIAHLFMMNNVHYIVQKIKGSPELREMIGDDYLRKMTGKFRQAATSYQRATWVKVLYCLRDEGLHVSGSFSSGVSKSALRERFKSFNAIFEEVHRTQATWLVPDSQLREELRISISEKLIPAYRSFLGRFRSHIESGKHPENYIKYSVEDLETAVLDFFEGYSVSQHLRRRSN